MLSATTFGLAHSGGTGALRAAEMALVAAEYQLPDDSVPEICIGLQGEDEDGKPVLNICPACLLVSACALTPHVPVVLAIFREAIDVALPASPAPVPAMRFFLIQQPRAPPSLT